MRYGKVYSAAIHGIDGILVVIEIALLPGLPGFEIVGLGDSAIRESRNRIQAAIRNSGFDFPVSRVTASLAPAWLRKEGSGFDLPIAVAILIASGQLRLPTIYQQHMPAIVGELSLDGQVRATPGVFNRVATCADEHLLRMFVPADNLIEAQAVEASDLKLFPVLSLHHCVELLRQADPLVPIEFPEVATTRLVAYHAARAPLQQPSPVPDISHIVGQPKAVRALTIAASGWHHLLLLGSPGSGKTSLATTIPGLLPPLEYQESRLVTRIHSAAGQMPAAAGLIRTRPFCAPHFTVTRAALVGGGSPPVPGLCSLAHSGVLFLDELTQMDSRTLDVLRQPLEARQVQLARLKSNITFPADFLLVAAANPCQCGEYFEPGHRCHCSTEAVERHISKISGPLLDRIDLAVEVLRPKANMLRKTVEKSAKLAVKQTKSDACSNQEQAIEDSASIREKISMSWALQQERCAYHQIEPIWNGRLIHDDLAAVFEIPTEVLDIAQAIAESLRLSVRSYQKILRVARSIADLEQSTSVLPDHLYEAVQYRMRLLDDRTGGPS
ncbi:MAG: YifB family Mg chelatase-like AAA ATPase [Eubacteriales bacterium]|nr:YifB family Mg chelatase-like AAA ATPase [Eubacteriales bacterium]